ncbi:MAG: flagellar export protein FliJ [Deltaproteobacteria bacterium]|nr:flagellar export protein FliJ [Deltaproteobacteria bacterium]
MKKFNFRLNKVLDYRLTLKKESERELAQRNMRLRELEDELKQIVKAQDSTEINSQANMTMAEFSLVEGYLEYLQEKLVAQRELVAQATEAVEEARINYIEKAKESAVLEKLKKKKFEAYREETRRVERKDMNDLTTQRHRLMNKTLTGGGKN